MRFILICILLIFTTPLPASIMGITSYPLEEGSQALSAEMTGYLGQQSEMGAGVRFTNSSDNNLFDLSVAGAQEARSMILGSGLDIELVHEEINIPRLSIKPYVQHFRLNQDSLTSIGIAPALRKGIAINQTEVFPYLSFPNGVQIEGETQELEFHSALTAGASLALPNSREKILISFEASKSLGASSDHIATLISWIWN